MGLGAARRLPQVGSGAGAKPGGYTVYELRVSCGREVLRVQFFTPEELRELMELE